MFLLTLRQVRLLSLGGRRKCSGWLISHGRSICSVGNYAITKSCPYPTCKCQQMPEGLDIDYKRKLQGTAARYSEHVLIRTGAQDWPSRIEDDENNPLARDLKALLKREMLKSILTKGNVLVTNSSFSVSPNQEDDDPSTFLVSLMKSRLDVRVPKSQLDMFVRAVTTVPIPDGATSDGLKKEVQDHFISRPITDIVVLICGHGGRDIRCGKVGPILKREIEDKLAQSGITVNRDPIMLRGSDYTKGKEKFKSSLRGSAKVGLISHVGGHAFAGNVIIYLPSSGEFAHSGLSGAGIWYGRVQPNHVEGIIQKTILEGIVIEDLLRGVV
jgi:hypothetical protein